MTATDMTPEEFETMLTGWALGALDECETQRVEMLLTTDPLASATASRLAQAVALLGEDSAMTPPPHLREALMDRVKASPRIHLAANDPLTAYCNQIEALDALLETLDDDDWCQPAPPYAAPPYRWSVHGLVAHLRVIEQYTATQLGIPDGDGGRPHLESTHSHLSTGAGLIEFEMEQAPLDTKATWRRQAGETAAALLAGIAPPMEQTIEFHRFPFTVGTLLVARAFETWTHADDIRRATNQPTLAPSPGDLRAMSELSATSLPLLLPLVVPDRVFTGARVVLTGEGGCTYELGEAGESQVTLVADVLDYCRFAARRLRRDELSIGVEGNAEHAEELLSAAQYFAV